MDKNTKGVMFSKKSDEWATPQWLYDALDAIFQFTLDPCASHENHKCDKYFTMEDDGLAQSWEGERAFVNNPYSDTKGWTAKCAEEGKKPNTQAVQLIPSRTDTKYSQFEMFPNAQFVLFIKGRLKFGDQKNSAPFPSMIPFYSQEALQLWQVEKLEELGSLVIPVQELKRQAAKRGTEW